MRRLTLLAILALVAFLAPSPTTADDEAAEAAPSAVIAETVFKAGEIPVGEPIEAEFAIENQGDARLEIESVQPDCGCTVAKYDEVIEPGATGTVRAVVDTTSLLGPSVKTISVLTNDPEHRRIKLTIEAHARPFLTLDPGHARFSTFVREEHDQSIPQLLWTDDFEELEITGVETPEDWVEVSYREATETERSDEGVGKQWRVDVTLSKDAPVGPLADRILLRTNHPKQKVVEIPVTGFVRPMVAVMPPRVDFGKIDLATAKRWGVLVRTFGSSPLQIESIESSIEGIEVEIEPVQEGQQYYLVFTPTEAMAKGPFKGEVEVQTNLPDRPKLTVSLLGEVL